MGAFADYIAGSDIQQPAATDDTPGQFTTGLRSGLHGALSQLQAAAGGVGEAVGATDFAAGAYGASRAEQAEAQKYAPRVTDWRNVNGLRDAYDYTTGIMGQSLPQMVPAVAAGLVGGRGALPAIARAGATLAPFEIGDVIQRQQDDPVAMQQSAGSRLADAAIGGGASALAQGVVPGLVAGKFVGQGVAKTLRAIPAGMAANVAEEGLAESAGEVAKQGGAMLSNPDRKFDTKAIIDAGVGGAVGGLGYGGAGAVADAAHLAAQTPGNILSGVKDAAGRLATQGREKVGDLAATARDEGPVMVSGAADGLKDLMNSGRAQARDWWDAVKEGRDTLGIGTKAGAAMDAASQALHDSERAQTVKKAYDEMMGDKDLPQAMRDGLSSVTDLADKAQQATVANVKDAWTKAKTYAQTASQMASYFKQGYKEGKENGADYVFSPEDEARFKAVFGADAGAKFSKDYSGLRRAIMDSILPVLQEKVPQALASNQSINDTADAVNYLLQKVARPDGKAGVLTDADKKKVHALFGDAAEDVLAAAYNAVYDHSNAATTQAFFGAMNDLHDARNESVQFTQALKKYAPAGMSDDDLTAVGDHLTTWARDYTAKTNDPKERSAARAMIREVQAQFGDNADAVMDMVLARVGQKENSLSDLNTGRVAEKDDTGTVSTRDADPRSAPTLAERETSSDHEAHYYGTGADEDELVLAPRYQKDKEKNQVTAALERAKRDNPDKAVKFLKASELGEDHRSVQTAMNRLAQAALEDGMTPKAATAYAKKEIKKYGMVVAEGDAGEATVTRRDLKDLKLVTKEGETYTNDARLEVTSEDGKKQVLDAIGLTRMMSKRIEYAEGETKAQRTARAFKQGVASMALTGLKVNVPDDTVIGFNGDKPMTWGEAKKLDPRSQQDRADDKRRVKDTVKLKELRDEYRQARDAGNEAAMEDIQTEAQEVHDRHARDVLGFDPDEASPVDSDGMRSESALAAYLQESDGKQEADPFGNIYEALRGKGEIEFQNPNGTSPLATNVRGERRERTRAESGEGYTRGTAEGVNVNSDGSGRTAPFVKANKYAGLMTRFDAMAEGGTAPQKAIAKRGQQVLMNEDILTTAEKKRLKPFLSDKDQKPMADIAAAINEIHPELMKRVRLRDGKPAEAEATAPATDKVAARVDERVTKEDYSFKDDAASMAFLQAAAKRLVDLHAKSDNRTEAEDVVYFRLKDQFKEDARHQADLSAFMEGADTTDADVRKAIYDAVPEVTALARPKGQAARSSAQGVNTGKQAGAASQAGVAAYITKVLGPNVRTEFVKLMHAGEFERMSGYDVVRISVHALSPLSTAWHESIHGLMAKLGDQKNGQIGNVLMNAAMTDHVQSQLKVLLASEPGALAQLSDPEEAAAYMFQFWMQGKLTVGPAPRTIFQRLKAAIEKALGMWSSDQRAIAVMEYFSKGEFAANVANPGAVRKALWESGRNAQVEAIKQFTDPVIAFGDKVLAPAGTRMREAGIPALKQIADLVRAERTASQNDPGYLSASRVKYGLYMNQLATRLQAFTKQELTDALEAMQNPTLKATASPSTLAIVDLIQGPAGTLPTMYAYMKKAGVDVSRFQPRPDYFPRSYNVDYLSRHEAEFIKVLETHGVPTAEAIGISRNIIANDGSQYTVEVMRPGMQNLKERALDNVPDSELAPFMQKDPFRILSSYIAQATRRAEWTRRFGTDNERLNMLMDDATKQGATKEQLAMAEDFIKATNGTLGDSIDPKLRRVMGNIQVYQNIRLLPLTIFSNLVDPMGIIVRGGKVQDAFTAWKLAGKEIVRTFKKEYQADAMTKLAEQMGTIDNAVLSHEMSSLYTQGMVGDTAKKVNDVFFRYNLSEGMNRAMRVAATHAAISFIEEHADGTASPHSVRWLAEIGLKPGDVTGPIDARAHPNVKAAINRWVDGAVLRPDAVDRTLWMSNPHFMLIAHLKQFVYAFQETILKRVAHEYRHGNYAPAMALASYVPIMIAADAVKHLIQGGGELPEWKKKWGVTDYVASGMERAGLFGTRQIGLDAMTDLTRGELWLGSLTGPAVDQAFTGASVLGGRSSGRSWAVDALPANDLYESALKGRAKSVE